MLTEYIEHAMRKARYDLMESGCFFGSIAPCRSCCGEGATLEECRDDLRAALECWILVGVRHGDELPVIDDIDLNAKFHAEANQAADEEWDKLEQAATRAQGKPDFDD
jgi:predicted RNase H-like HicB family nuclease